MFNEQGKHNSLRLARSILQWFNYKQVQKEPTNIKTDNYIEV